MAQACAHTTVSCVNPWEFVRKYRCADCSGVMMCVCDEARGRRFLPHQLARGRDYETQSDVPVTHGFQKAVCRRCRGLPETPHPKAQMHGAMTKVRRYYWREIWFDTAARFAATSGSDDVIAHHGTPALEQLWDKCEKDAVEHFKQLHEVAPIYVYDERTQEQVIAEYAVEVVDLRAQYGEGADNRARVLWRGEAVTPEGYVIRYYQDLGYSAFFSESVPFHVLVGAFLWQVVQAPNDDQVRLVIFGDRLDFKADRKPRQIVTGLPPDFGRAGYGKRRALAIASRLGELPTNKAELIEELNAQLIPSEDLRQYLWGVDDEQIDTARRLLGVLPPKTVRRILEYLITSYYDRYCGWPDLLVSRPGEYFFAEVKGSGDKLSEDQKKWIRGNHEVLKLPFKLVKIHRENPPRPFSK